MRATLGLVFAALFVACSGDGGSSGSSVPRLVAYDATDPCSTHTDELGCSADTANGCSWIALGVPCPANTACPGGVCQQPDACSAHRDAPSCESDPDCAWAAVELCPPPGDSCPGGFCNAKSDGCACACPLYCAADGTCPPCECECPPAGGGGGSDGCVCACTACAPGETCLPCECSCVVGGDPGCGVGEDTCTCVCPACAPGETCPPCSCGGGSAQPSP
jgi:hypothetical protein